MLVIENIVLGGGSKMGTFHQDEMQFSVETCESRYFLIKNDGRFRVF